MKLSALLCSTSLLLAANASAAIFESGDWAAAKVGHACHVFTQRAARDTSGALVFTFHNQGYSSGFGYDYHPWPGETAAPWDEDDFAVLAFDGQESWLGDEMFTHEGTGGYGAYITDGMVPDMITSILNSKTSIEVMFDRAAKGEVWLYGKFSPTGFAESLQKAGEWCAFNPRNLPSS
ncbi:hypothetical protein [Parasedimentitalea huanghaiensis]|uniref:Uncharacterized protein n=1 Tax=Parasedimentitalea huanghaiensis TaxID=2682100 RepID=A0A6L6WH80_9RHOB|nr:hypothetical protein [Zongyanglinia huanghaiensis]MVO15925.1 hypothetical protein [Zongyanglinia huanghaiensis]